MARNFCTKPSLCAASACLSASASMAEDGLLFHLGEQLNWFQRLFQPTLKEVKRIDR